MFALEFIPEWIWEKNKLYVKQQKIRWILTYDEVRDFCELENIPLR